MEVQQQTMQKQIGHNSWVHVVKGKKAPPIVDFMVQVKFQEERRRWPRNWILVYTVFPLPTHFGLFPSLTTLWSLDLEEINLEFNWRSTIFFLVLWFHSSKDPMWALKAKKKPVSLPNSHQDFLKCRSYAGGWAHEGKRTSLVARKKNRWAVI